MRKALPITFILCGLCAVVYAQSPKLYTTQTEVRPIADKPTVYITFERAGKRQPLELGESNEGIWLRLHNNSRWVIFFPAFGVPEALGEAGLFYEVEAVRRSEVSRDISDASIDRVAQEQDKATPQLPIGYRVGHLSSTVRLAPGDSIVFSVPREHLAKGLALRVGFYYEWQDADEVFAGREPQSHIYFFSSKLPQKVQ
jgi:hypothetical protein